ncbi:MULTISPECIES: hypothetical protein [unclassified Streptomyces]|uniref:hypothetical protein n=1 Tax=unclassified Streptomyces TaxID=2593676 RepID=UPI002ED323E2|nr:hypothetical protein OH827_19625 [Streptomyces sp. NBC_00891]WSY07076.1 hypothetical protein OG464_19625 [Streptomyces sp. NBC_00890]WSZ08703.1 hypothetical protein OG704_19630 [Streptomyces sp. NBC_00869]WSZ23799.1 hypothetical protein OG498_13940 [Streptomyces sp. NBC_00870]
MIRNVLGAVLALAGAAAAVLSPFRDWYDGRLGRHYRLGDLFTGTGVTGAHPGLFGSLWLPFLCAAVVTVLGVLLRSRALVVLAGVAVLGFTVLWMVRVFQVTDSLAVTGDGSGLGPGVALALGGGVLMLLGAWAMSGRRRAARYDAPGSGDPDTWPPTREPGPSVQTSPWPEPEGDDPYVGPPPDSPGPRSDSPGAPGTRPSGGHPGPSGD